MSALPVLWAVCSSAFQERIHSDLWQGSQRGNVELEPPDGRVLHGDEVVQLSFSVESSVKHFATAKLDSDSPFVNGHRKTKAYIQ